MLKKKPSVFDLIASTVENGPSLPMEEELFSLCKRNSEGFNYLKDQPKGSGLYMSFLYNVTRTLKPEIIVELGNREGRSTNSIVAGMDEKQELYTVDIKRQLTEVHEHVLQQSNVTALFGSSADPQIVDQVPNNIDLLFIDTEHTIEHLNQEWSLFESKLSDHAIVAVDDINWTGLDQFTKMISKRFKTINSTELHGSGFLVFEYKR